MIHAARVMNRCARGVLSVSALLTVAACGVTEPGYGGGDYERSFMSNGWERSYRLHVPPTITPQQAVPLVIVFHGASQDGNDIRRLSGFDAVADERGVLVAYLDGVDHVRETWGFYGLPAYLNGIDDAQFTVDVIDTLAVTFAIDRDRVYAAGFSNGGLFVHQLGCQLRGTLAAIASVAASLTSFVEPLCNEETVIPAVFIHGTEDGSFPWLGAPGFMAPEEMFLFWANLSGCTSGPTVTTLPDVLDNDITVDRHDYSDCALSDRITLYAIQGGHHTWPRSAEFSASETIMDFFGEVSR